MPWDAKSLFERIEVLCSFTTKGRVVLKISDAKIASITKEPSCFVRLVIMIYAQILSALRALRFPAYRTKSFLLLKETIVKLTAIIVLFKGYGSVFIRIPFVMLHPEVHAVKNIFGLPTFIAPNMKPVRATSIFGKRGNRFFALTQRTYFFFLWRKMWPLGFPSGYVIFRHLGPTCFAVVSETIFGAFVKAEVGNRENGIALFA
jgi:hypothetical protein